jgi:hypothetical protein
VSAGRARRLHATEADITGAVLDYLALVGAWSLKAHGHLGQAGGSAPTNGGSWRPWRRRAASARW